MTGAAHGSGDWRWAARLPTPIAATCAVLLGSEAVVCQQWITREKPLYGSVVSAAFDSGRQRLVLLAEEQSSKFTTWEWDGRSWMRRTLAANPSYRRSFGIAYDEHRRRTVLFGGHDGLRVLSDTWEYDGFDWQLRAPAASPPARHEHGLAYDASRQRCVVFGGSGSMLFDDTWEWDGTTWTHVVPASRPPPRNLPGMTWDPARSAILLFGGYDLVAFRALNDTWSWDGKAWTRLSPMAAPSVRVAPTLGGDPGRRRVLLFGGWPETPGSYSDTWEWDGSGWTEMSRKGPILPDRSVYPRLLYVPPRGRLMLVGGSQAWGDVWEWHGNQWTHAASIPDGHWGGPIAYDVRRERIVQSRGGRTLEWDGGTWTAIQPTAFHPDVNWAQIVFDLSRDVCVLVGHHWRGSTMTAEWDGTGWRQPSSSLQPPVSYPDFALAFDTARRRTIFFGGSLPQLPPVYLGETWEWDGSNWTRRPVPRSPTPRIGHAMACDVERRRVVLFGGSVWPRADLDDTWEWDGTTWAALQPPVRPPARADHSMAYDPIRRRVVLHGGWTPVTSFQDTWEFDGKTWTKLNVPPAYGGPMAFHLALQRMVMAGLGGETLLLGDTPAAATTHGAGCGPGGGPRLEPFGKPWLGNLGFACDLYRARSQAPALVTLSLGEVDLHLGGGCRLYVDAGRVALLALASTDGDGFARVSLGVPAVPQLSGLRLFGQSVVFDPQGPWAGLSLTQGVRFVIGD